eukprot:gene7687-7887_t
MASTEQLEPPADWFEQLRQKDEQITTLERKLDHFRSWLSNLQGQLQAKDPQIVKNARRLYVGGIPEDTKEIRRPSNYNAAEAIDLGPVSPDPTVDVSELPMCKTVVEDSWNKIFIGGLPCNYGDEQVCYNGQ